MLFLILSTFSLQRYQAGGFSPEPGDFWSPGTGSVDLVTPGTEIMAQADEQYISK